MTTLKKLEDISAPDVETFSRLAEHLRDIAGISLPANDKNMSLMAARIAPILARRKLAHPAALARLLELKDPTTIDDFVCALTTNTTEFFREHPHFRTLTDEIRRIMTLKAQNPDRTLRIWCAAASTGQEIYSILMTLLEGIPALQGWSLEVLATDIDREVLARAVDGVYRGSELAGVSPLLKQKYFVTHGEELGEKTYQVHHRLRDLVTFGMFNLTSWAYPFPQPFDVIFCRNVLIYFDRVTAEQVTRRLFGVLAVGGTLFLGHSETGLLRGQEVEPVATAVYRRGAKP